MTRRRKIRPDRLALAAVSAAVSVLHADEAADEIAQAFLTSVDALVVLTSQDMLTGGQYVISGSAEETRLRLYNFPFYYHFRPFSEHLNWFVNGSAGISETRQEPDFGFGEKDETLFDTVALRFGGGLRVKSGYGLQMLLGVNFIYSYVHNTYRYNSPESEALLKPLLDGIFTNHGQSNYTYELFWQIGYAPHWGAWKPYAMMQTNYFDTKADFNTQSLSHFTSRSGSAKIRFGVQTPPFVSIGTGEISIEGYVQGTTFTGSVRDTLGFDGYGATALIGHYDLSYPRWIVDRIDLMVENVAAEGIRGYNIGLGAGFDFSAF